MVLFTFLLLSHAAYTQKIPKFQAALQWIKGILVKMITDSLGKSAETGKGSKAGKAHPAQNMSV